MLILVQHEQIVIILIMLAGQPQARREEHPSLLFPFPGAVVSLSPQTGGGGRSLCRSSYPQSFQITRAWFIGEEVTKTVAKAGQRDFLLDSFGTIQDRLLSDCGSGELLFGVPIHPSSILPPFSEALNEPLST